MEFAGLAADRTEVRSGEDLRVWPPEDGSLGVSGTVSRFEVRRDGEWVTLYRLISPFGAEGQPSWKEIGEAFWVTAVGVAGPVVVRIPPVPPGRYRIARDYSSIHGDERSQVTAAVELTVR